MQSCQKYLTLFVGGLCLCGRCRSRLRGGRNGFGLVGLGGVGGLGGGQLSGGVFGGEHEVRRGCWDLV